MRTAEQAASDNRLIEELSGFLRARFEEDRAVAVAASTSYDHMTPTGEHWRWAGEHDEKITIDPDAYTREVLNVLPDGDYTSPNLWSVEEYPSSTGPLSHLVLSSYDEVSVAVGDHIVRQSPAHVIEDLDAKLTMLTMWAGSDDWEAASLLYRFALRYRQHPDWRPEFQPGWRPIPGVDA